MGADWDVVEYVEDRKGHDRRYSIDDSKLRSLGYAPRHTFERGLAETVRWYRDHEAWWRPLKEKAADHPMTRWLVAGVRGQLGSELIKVLGHRPTADVLGVGRTDLDITDASAVDDVLTRYRPDVVVNAAAYTAVDAAEDDEDRAHAVNALGPENLARASARLGSRLVQVSTDYVFSGTADRPYDEDAQPDPRSAYGRTKLAGERAVARLLDSHYVVRTAWLYGETGANFVKTMMRLEQERETVSVVNDQYGAPTWSRDVASALVNLAETPAPYGTYHCTNTGQTTWYDLARAVFEEVGADPARVESTTTDAFPRPATRPAFSVLDCGKWVAAGLQPLPPWRDALRSALPLMRTESALDDEP